MVLLQSRIQIADLAPHHGFFVVLFPTRNAAVSGVFLSMVVVASITAGTVNRLNISIAAAIYQMYRAMMHAILGCPRHCLLSSLLPLLK